MELPMAEFRRLNQTAKAPSKATSGSCGFDLYANFDGSERDWWLQPSARTAIGTGIVLKPPAGHYGRVAPRSGLAFNSGIDVMAGVIDWDYRGEIKVILINLGDKPFRIREGDKIAQIIFERYWSGEMIETNDLGDTARGSSGFGSSGTQ